MSNESMTFFQLSDSQQEVAAAMGLPAEVTREDLWQMLLDTRHSAEVAMQEAASKAQAELDMARDDLEIADREIEELAGRLSALELAISCALDALAGDADRKALIATAVKVLEAVDG